MFNKIIYLQFFRQNSIFANKFQKVSIFDKSPTIYYSIRPIHFYTCFYSLFDTHFEDLTKYSSVTYFSKFLFLNKNSAIILCFRKRKFLKNLMKTYFTSVLRSVPNPVLQCVQLGGTEGVPFMILIFLRIIRFYSL